MLNNVDYIIAGAGISGITAARKLAENGKKILLVEKTHKISGHCFDYQNERGIYIHKYGPHIFHTENKNVWGFLSEFTNWHSYQHSVDGYIDGKLVPIPFNLNSIHSLFPEQKAKDIENKLLEIYEYDSRIPILELKKSKDKDLLFLADFIYNKVFLNYTLKQWGGVSPEDLDPSVSARVPVVVSRDDRYFSDKYQGIPVNGYTTMMQNMLNHPNIHLLLNTKIEDVIDIKGDKILFNSTLFNGKVIYTGSIDALFDYKYGELPYRSINLELETLNVDGHIQPKAVINYPNNYNFTRITEYKHFQKSKIINSTTICKEFPTAYIKGKNIPFYVIHNDESMSNYSLYKHDVDNIDNLYCLGRLAEFKYYDMDDAVESALDLVDNL